MTSPYDTLNITGTINLPLMLNANDYHEFNDTIDLLRSCVQLPASTSKWPALDYEELGFLDGCYQAIVYSPAALGRRLNWKQDKDFLVQALARSHLDDIDKRNVKQKTKTAPKTSSANLVRRFMETYGFELMETLNVEQEYVERQFMTVLFERNKVNITEAVMASTPEPAGKIRTPKI